MTEQKLGMGHSGEERGKKTGEEMCREKSGADEDSARARADCPQTQPQCCSTCTGGSVGEPDLAGTRQRCGGEDWRGDRDRGVRGAGGRDQIPPQQQEKVRGGGGHGCAASSQTLVIMYMNAQSLVGKVNELSCSLSDMNLDLNTNNKNLVQRGDNGLILIYFRI
jgi:hypothetical protein